MASAFGEFSSAVPGLGGECGGVGGLRAFGDGGAAGAGGGAGAISGAGGNWGLIGVWRGL
jgi:hypothetical protein